jgi:hypothetical protein
MHIILVRVIHSIQNSCIKYAIQNQHFAEMFTYSDNTNYNLNFYYFIFPIYLWFNLFGNYSYVSDVSDFRVLSTAPSFDETAGICAIVAVVDTRRVLRARETTARGVYPLWCSEWDAVNFSNITIWPNKIYLWLLTSGLSFCGRNRDGHSKSCNLSFRSVFNRPFLPLNCK